MINGSSLGTHSAFGFPSHDMPGKLPGILRCHPLGGKVVPQLLPKEEMIKLMSDFLRSGSGMGNDGRTFG